MPIVVFTLDFTPPIVSANPVGGRFQVLTSVLLTANEPATVYWTTDGSVPTIGGPTTSSAASPALAALPAQLQVRLRFFARDLAGNDSILHEEIYFIKPLNTTVRTRFGPLVKHNQIDALATISDVTVYVDGVPVTISGIRPLHNEIYLVAPPPAGSEVRVAYCWFDNPSYQIGLNDIDHVLNAVNGYNATDVPYTLVLNEPVVDQPAEVTWEYTAFERRYTAALNNPDLLLLNEPIHEIKHPETGRPTHSEFVLNWANTIYSYEQVKSDGDPTVLNDGTPVYPLIQNDDPVYGPAIVLNQSAFSSNPDLWKSYDVLVLDGNNVYALQKVAEEGFYIGLETSSTSVGVSGLLSPACDRFTEIGITLSEDPYEPPYQNCGFLYFNPPTVFTATSVAFTHSLLNECFVLYAGAVNQTHEVLSTRDEDIFPIHGVVEDGLHFSVGFNDIRTCEDLGFILNDFTLYVNGSILTVPGASILDGETLVLNDGTNPSITFEFDDGTSPVSETNVLRALVYTSGFTATAIRDLIISAINTSTLAMNMIASVGGSNIVNLTTVIDSLNIVPNILSNISVTETVADVGFVVSSMVPTPFDLSGTYSYMNDAAVATGVFVQPGSYLYEPLDCYNDESMIKLILASTAMTSTYLAAPFESTLILVP